MDRLKNYMFFENLEQLSRDIDKLMSLDKDKVDAIITNGHDWDKSQSSTSVAIIGSRILPTGAQLGFDNYSSLTQYQPVAINNNGGNILADAEL